MKEVITIKGMESTELGEIGKMMECLDNELMRSMKVSHVLFGKIKDKHALTKKKLDMEIEKALMDKDEV